MGYWKQYHTSIAFISKSLYKNISRTHLPFISRLIIGLSAKVIYWCIEAIMEYIIDYETFVVVLYQFTA